MQKDQLEGGEPTQPHLTDQWASSAGAPAVERRRGGQRRADRFSEIVIDAAQNEENRRHRVLVVDDNPAVRDDHERMLRSLGYETEAAGDGIEALVKLSLDIDLVLLDAKMPNMDGYEVVERIRGVADHFDLPIIMVTGLDKREDRMRAVEVGVNDFISKPCDLTELKLRSATLLRLKDTHDALRHERFALEATVARRTAALRQALDLVTEAKRQTYEAHLDTIRRLVAAAEYRDPDTGSHIVRIGLYSAVLAEGLRLAPGRVELIGYASPMHDVGKIGIPDSILLKPGPLTPGEREVVEQHATIGAHILEDSPSEVLRLGAVIAASHHERFDGNGYPGRVSGKRIPIEGRICAVVDVFDALTMPRPYRGALPVDTVQRMLEEGRGRQFDTDVLDVFFDHLNEIKGIRDAHQEPSPILA